MVATRRYVLGWLGSLVAFLASASGARAQSVAYPKYLPATEDAVHNWLKSHPNVRELLLPTVEQWNEFEMSLAPQLRWTIAGDRSALDDMAFGHPVWDYWLPGLTQQQCVGVTMEGFDFSYWLPRLPVDLDDLRAKHKIITDHWKSCSPANRCERCKPLSVQGVTEKAS